MANIFKPKRSNTAAKVPTTTDLASGEIGVNMADQKVYINNGTSVVQVGAGKLSGHVDVTLTSLATGQTLQWNGTAWVNFTGGSGTVTGVTATAPVVSSGGTAPVISMAAATASVNGYMTSTYAAKLDGIAAGATANTGTVTSVGGTGTVSGLTLTGTVTTSGNLTLGGTLAVTPSNFASQTANYILAAPNGAAGAPTFRALVAADVPTLNQNTTGSAATLTTGRTIGITGDITYTSPSFNGSGNVTAAATLATVNSNVGSFGSATSIPVVTVNAKGLVTAVSTATVAGGQYFGAAATKAIAYNANTISENVTVTAGNNGLSAGPITISTGYTVTVETGAAWVIV